MYTVTFYSLEEKQPEDGAEVIFWDPKNGGEFEECEVELQWEEWDSNGPTGVSYPYNEGEEPMEDRWEAVNGDWVKLSYKLAYSFENFDNYLYRLGTEGSKRIRWAYSQELWDNLSGEVVLSNNGEENA